MASAEEYRARIDAVALDELIDRCSSGSDPVEAAQQCLRIESEIRGIESDVNEEIRSLRSSYEDRVAAAGKGGSKLSGLFGRRGGGADRSPATRAIRAERDAAIAPYKKLKLTIDDLHVRIAEAKQELGEHLEIDAEPVPPLSSVKIDTSGWQEAQSSPQEVIWTNETPDYLMLNLFPAPPDLPSPLSDLDPIRRHYRDMMAGEGCGIVEIESASVAELPALQVIVKVPQEPTGMTYVGSLILPFRELSFVIRIQCPEHGITGMREAAVIGKLGLASSVGPDGRIPNWMQDPYDATFESPVLRNKAEDPEWDASFPDHPLSRVRARLAWLRDTIRVAPELRELPGFSG